MISVGGNSFAAAIDLNLINLLAPQPSRAQGVGTIISVKA